MTQSLSAVRASALLTHILGTTPSTSASSPSLPSPLSTLLSSPSSSSILDRSSLGVLLNASENAREMVCKTINARLEDAHALVSQGEGVLTSLTLLRTYVSDSRAGSDESLRSNLEAWNRSVQRIIKNLVFNKPGSSAIPPLTPLLTVVACETLVEVQRRYLVEVTSSRRELGTGLATLLPALMRVVQLAQGQTIQATDANGKQTTSVTSWSFIPPAGLDRSLQVVLDLILLHKHSFRFGVEQILTAITPLLQFHQPTTRSFAARILAALTQIQAHSSKKKLTTDGDNNDEAMDDEAEEKKLHHAQAAAAAATASLLPDDPWSLMMQHSLNSFHALLDEMDAAGDAILQESNAVAQWKSMPRVTQATLTFPALPSPNPSHQPLTRALVLQSRMNGLMELLNTLLDPRLFNEMQVANADAYTLPLPAQGILLVLQRLFTFELNPHQLLQITGRPLPRAALATVLPDLLESGVGVVESLLEIGGTHLQPISFQLADVVKELMSRHAFLTAEQRHSLPRLMPRLYTLAAELIENLNAGASLVKAFVLPTLSIAIEDAERIVQLKNLQLQLNFNASSMHAFTGAALSKEKRASSGNSSNKNALDHASDASAVFVQNHNLAQASVIGVAALNYLQAILTSVGPQLPSQKRVQLDRSLCAMTLAIQGGSWAVIESFRNALYETITASVTIPVAAASEKKNASSSTPFSAFSLLPHAVQFFKHASVRDPSRVIQANCQASLRICNALLHPRSLPLAAARISFAQGESQDDSAELSGLVQGRDGSLYMQLQPQTEEDAQDGEEEEGEDEEEEEGEEEAEAEAAAEPATEASDAAVSITVTAPQPTAGTKRTREPETAPEADAEDDNSESRSSKRMHLESTPAAAPTATPTAPAAAAATAPVAAEEPADAVDEAPMDADAGPDADEADQGSLWTL